MELRGTWENGSFTADVFAAESILYMRLSGVVTLPHYYQACAFAAGVGTGHRHAALLIDNRKSLLAISEPDILASPPASPSKWRPIAFLVPKENEEMFKRLAWRRAEQGLERLVFTSGRAAIAWGQGVATRSRVRAALQSSRPLVELGPRPAFAPSAPIEL